jgi:hypothetical protein
MMAAPRTPIPLDPGEYTIVWKFMPDGWAKDVSELPAPVSMPYFVDGEAYQKVLSKQPAELTPYGLLCGVLLSWFQPNKLWFYGKNDPLQEFLGDLLEELRQGFNRPTVEDMILSVAASMRDNHGSAVASGILTAGVNVIPASKDIRSDLIADVWTVINTADQVDRDSAFRFILEAREGIDLQGMDPRQVDMLDHICREARAFLGETG